MTATTDGVVPRRFLFPVPDIVRIMASGTPEFSLTLEVALRLSHPVCGMRNFEAITHAVGPVIGRAEIAQGLSGHVREGTSVETTDVVR
jgi:hypothetical protein